MSVYLWKGQNLLGNFSSQNLQRLSVNIFTVYQKLTSLWNSKPKHVSRLLRNSEFALSLVSEFRPLSNRAKFHISIYKPIELQQYYSVCIRSMSFLPFYADYDKRGAAKCKKCKQKLDKGVLRIAKVITNPFTEEGGEMKQWHHVDCLFESFKRARATTKKIDDPQDDIGGWESLEEDDKKLIRQKVAEYQEEAGKKPTTSKAKPSSSKITPKKKDSEKPNSHDIKMKLEKDDESSNTEVTGPPQTPNKDDMFKEFRRLCANVAEVSSYLSKTQIISDFFKNGTDGDGFNGDLRLWVHLLLPGVVKRVYNLQSKQLIKLFSQMFEANQEEMLEDLEKGDIAETVRIFFEASTFPQVKKSILTLKQVDSLLDELEGQTTEEAQMNVLRKAARKCTGNDLKMFVRLIKGDLRIGAGSKHILEGVHPDAYEAFQTTRNIDAVIDQILHQQDTQGSGERRSGLKIEAKVMTPVLPMLAEACRSVSQALKKCPNGMYAEIKYDGERVQVHKKGKEFRYFSRSLKPVLAHKVAHFKDFIPSAFPYGKSLILDAEVLLIDTKTGLPLPFGTLGKHKKEAFKDANVCLFVFDCIHYNGENLMDRPICERRKILKENMKVIPNHIVLSEMKEVHKADQLQSMIQSVLSQGLEGLVLKDLKSIYEPGKRHWLKVKKDYLNEGAMADSADLVVLGASFGTGKKGGMMSIFLMGCYDPVTKKWCTVTKVHTGHDDAALERLQNELKMDKISQNYDLLPKWFNCSRSLTPDFVASDPKKSPVWEITGAEFTQNKGHTADGISIRFPRVTRERPDKGWKDATNLPRLQELYKKSKEHTDIVGLKGHDDDDDGGDKGSGSGASSDADDTDVIKSSRNKTPAKRKQPSSSERTGTPKKMKQTTLSHLVSPKKELNEAGNKVKEPKLSKFNESTDNFKPPVENPLPDIFNGIKLRIPEDTEDCEKLTRYFIAFGGETVEDFSEEATHILLTEEKQKKSTSDKKLVTVDWLWDCVKLKSLQPSGPYIQ